MFDLNVEPSLLTIARVVYNLAKQNTQIERLPTRTPPHIPTGFEIRGVRKFENKILIPTDLKPTGLRTQFQSLVSYAFKTHRHHGHGFPTNPMHTGSQCLIQYEC